MFSPPLILLPARAPRRKWPKSVILHGGKSIVTTRLISKTTVFWASGAIAALTLISAITRSAAQRAR